jgi:erythromycin esterase
VLMAANHRFSLAGCLAAWLLLPWSLVLAPAPIHAQPPLNLDFEEAGVPRDQPKHWLVTAEGYDVRLDDTAHSGERSLRIESKNANSECGWARAFLPASLVAGKRLRFIGWIKTEKVLTGHAGVGLEVFGAEGLLGSAYLRENLPSADTQWTACQVETLVHPDAHYVYLCVYLFANSGSAWFDSLRLEVDGISLKDAYHQQYTPLTRQERIRLLDDAVLLNGTAPSDEVADLRPLKAMLHQARIVAIGQPSHGTKESFQLSHRLLQLLCGEMGFRILVVEEEMVPTHDLNRFLLTGQGDIEQLTERATFQLGNKESVNLLRWMRAFNQSGRGSLQIWGCDMNYPGTALDRVQRFVEKADPDYLEALKKAYAPFFSSEGSALDIDSKDLGALSLATRSDVLGRATNVLHHLEQTRIQYLTGHSASEVDWAIQSARIIEQFAALLVKGSHTPRDAFMAANFAWALKQVPDGSKVVLVAHNGHVAKGPMRMGMHLAKRYGKEFVVLGTAVHEGKYRAPHRVLGWKIAEHDVTPSYPGSVDWYLHQTGLPHFILDLAKASKRSEAQNWLRRPLDLRYLGGTANDWQFYSVRLAEEYDGLIFLDNTTPATPLW